VYNSLLTPLWSNSLFENLEPKPADAILKLIAEHRDDPRDNKIDLGVGVYRDETGVTPILKTVKTAEQWLVDNQASKAYLGCAGDPEFCKAIQNLTFGEGSDQDGRITTLQTPGGSAALRVAAGLILRAKAESTMWVSDPTWNNHVPLLGGAGVKLQTYPYYDNERNCIRFDEMLAALGAAAAGDLVLLHGCCHNPTGMDLTVEQWQQLADVLADRDLVPFIDFAYHGFAVDLDADAYPVRLMFDHFAEIIVANSCSKNFGLYRDRVGSLSVVGASAESAAIVNSQAQNIVRTLYSVPPDHGGAVVARILNDDELRANWLVELAGMRQRLQGMRKLLVTALRESAPDHDFSHIERANGMFCYLGVSAEQVARLKKDYGIYLVDSSRINVCGITEGNVRYLAESIAAVL
jgi:aspartate/tyrosine/aromatic aminotransferase